MFFSCHESKLATCTVIILCDAWRLGGIRDFASGALLPVRVLSVLVLTTKYGSEPAGALQGERKIKKIKKYY
jgi:hypothetical protein